MAVKVELFGDKVGEVRLRRLRWLGLVLKRDCGCSVSSQHLEWEIELSGWRTDPEGEGSLEEMGFILLLLFLLVS